MQSLHHIFNNYSFSVISRYFLFFMNIICLPEVEIYYSNFIVLCIMHACDGQSHPMTFDYNRNKLN